MNPDYEVAGIYKQTTTNRTHTHRHVTHTWRTHLAQEERRIEKNIVRIGECEGGWRVEDGVTGVVRIWIRSTTIRIWSWTAQQFLPDACKSYIVLSRTSQLFWHKRYVDVSAVSGMLHNTVVNYATVCEGRVNQTNCERCKEYKEYRILFLEWDAGGKGRWTWGRDGVGFCGKGKGMRI